MFLYLNIMIYHIAQYADSMQFSTTSTQDGLRARI